MAGIFAPRSHKPVVVQCRARAFFACQLAIFFASMSSRLPASDVREKLCRAVRSAVCGSVWGAVQAPYLFFLPVRLNLLSEWCEPVFRVLVDQGRQPMGSALHYS